MPLSARPTAPLQRVSIPVADLPGSAPSITPPPPRWAPPAGQPYPSAASTDTPAFTRQRAPAQVPVSAIESEPQLGPSRLPREVRIADERGRRAAKRRLWITGTGIVALIGVSIVLLLPSDQSTAVDTFAVRTPSADADIATPTGTQAENEERIERRARSYLKSLVADDYETSWSWLSTKQQEVLRGEEQRLWLTQAREIGDNITEEGVDQATITIDRYAPADRLAKLTISNVPWARTACQGSAEGVMWAYYEDESPNGWRFEISSNTHKGRPAEYGPALADDGWRKLFGADCLGAPIGEPAV